MSAQYANADTNARKAAVNIEEEIAYLAKRHRVSPAIVREIVRHSELTDRGAIEREIVKGKARR